MSLHALAQLFTVLCGQRTRYIPKLFPGGLRLVSLLRMLVWYIQGTALAFATIGQVEMRTVPSCWVTMADAIPVATPASGLLQAALYHELCGF